MKLQFLCMKHALLVRVRDGVASRAPLGHDPWVREDYGGLSNR